MQRKRPLLGAHVSAAGGAHMALRRGEELGAEVIQIFGASPRSWSAPLPKKTDIEKFVTARATSTVREVYLHGAYLVNMGSADPALRARSVKNLTAHLDIAAALGAEGLIFHPGSGGGQLRETALEHIAAGMRTALETVAGETMLIMENTAGGGDKIGGTPDELATLLQLVDSPRAKVCIDTAHAFEAGLIEQYEPASLTAFIQQWDEAVGLDRIVALHINDSKTAYASHHDQHHNLGEGYIGLDGFKHLAALQQLAHTAWMLEVPGLEGMGPDKHNLDLLKACFTK